MRYGKLVSLLLILAITGACSTSETTTPDATSAEDAASSPEAAVPAVPAADKPKAEAPKPVIVPAGTTLNITLSTALDSGKNKAGDTFTGNLSEDVMIAGKTVLAKGTAVDGKVVEAEGSGRVSGKAKMSLTLTGATVKGKTVALSTNNHVEEAESTKGRDAAVIGGGAGVGAAIGAIAGGKKGAAIGAAVGGAGGTGAVLATKGKEVQYPAETRLDFTLEQELKL